MCWETIGACVLRLPTNTNKNYKTGIFKIHIMQDRWKMYVVIVWNNGVHSTQDTGANIAYCAHGDGEEVDVM